MSKANKVPRYVVGWSAIAAGNGLWHPKPPKSYKSAEAQAGWLEEHTADEPILPFVGLPSDIVVLDEQANEVELMETDALGLLPGGCRKIASFFEFVKYSFSDAEVHTSGLEPKALYFGFNIKQLMQSVAMIMLRFGGNVPPRMWYNAPGLFDISDMLIPGALRNGFDVGSLLEFAMYHYTAPTFPATTLQYVGAGRCAMETAQDKARVAYDLVKFARL